MQALGYIIRTLAGSIVGYAVGLAAGSGIIVWSSVGTVSSPQAEGVLGLLFIMSSQSAIIGAVAGLMTVRTRGWEMLWRTIPAGLLVGAVLVFAAGSLVGFRSSPKGELLIAASSARRVAAVNMLWGGLVGLVVGLCFLPFYPGERANPSPSSTSQDQGC